MIVSRAEKTEWSGQKMRAANNSNKHINTYCNRLFTLFLCSICSSK